jgi:hypothetical protein
MKNNNWIKTNKEVPSISEELINEGFNRVAVLVTDTYHDMSMIGWYDIEDGKFYKDYDILSDTFKNVIAWMSLPKIYENHTGI